MERKRTMLSRLKGKSLGEIVHLVRKKISERDAEAEVQDEDDWVNSRIFNILLITNRDSDNLGDLVIEMCDISLLKTIMKNLDMPEHKYKIYSRAASIVSRKYVSERDEKLLEPAEDLISRMDVVFFGGAPMFNYSYQIFYERTAVILELAQKHNKPVLFSAMGVEKYREGDARCLRLKQTLNLPCVRRITTRDDYDSLQKYVEDARIFTARVADPAVFCAEVCRNLLPKKSKKRKKKRVGIFVLRNDGFRNNGINFTRSDAVEMWLGLIRELEKEGYDYTLLANGHFADEAFLDYLIRSCGVSNKKCVFNMDSPEAIIRKISIYDAVISCRLHPSIISYSLGVPSLGIVWNSKVAQFYEAIGCADRTFGIAEADPAKIVEKLGTIIDKKPECDEAYRMSVYNTMFDGIKGIMQECGRLKADPAAYSYDELLANIVPYAGTSREKKDKYQIRKARRTYDNYNKLEMKRNEYAVIYNSGTKENGLQSSYDPETGKTRKLATGSVEHRLKQKWEDNGLQNLDENCFTRPGYRFVGWHVRLKNANVWYWLLENGDLAPAKDYPKGAVKMLLADKGRVPAFRLNNQDVAVFEAVWEKED